MTFPTIPSFSYEDPSVVVVYADSTILGNVKKASGSSKVSRKKKEFPRLSSTTIVTARGAATYDSTGQITLYENDSMADYLALIKGTSPASVDGDKSITLKVEIYDSTDPTTAALLYAWSLALAIVTDAGFDADASGDSTNNTINFESDSKWIMTVGP